MEEFERKIREYVPYNEQEEKDKEIMIKYIELFPNSILTRENEFAHFTASAFVLNKNRDKVLMIYHNIYKSWSWVGGHADGDKDFLYTATRETMEETGLKNITPISKEIFSVENICVNGHVKKGKYVGSHVHLNVTYLLEANEEELLQINPDENSGVKWIQLDKVKDESTEKWMVENVYNKIIKKIESCF